MTQLAANSPADRCEALILLTSRLTELLEQETALFIARKPLETQNFQDEKSKLATLYRREIKAIQEQPDLVEPAPEMIKARLKAETDKFTTALTANGDAVEALRLLTEGVVRSVADEAARVKEEAAGYGPGYGKAVGTAPSIAVNQRA